jgi:hypothetical protein
MIVGPTAPPAKTPLVGEVITCYTRKVDCKSPKSIAFPTEAIVTKSIIFKAFVPSFHQH